MVNAGTEPIEFTNLFPSWNENKDVQDIVSKVLSFIHSSSVCLPSVCLSISLPFNSQSIHVSVCLPTVCLYICSSIHLSVCLSINLFIIHLPLYPTLHYYSCYLQGTSCQPIRIPAEKELAKYTRKTYTVEELRKRPEEVDQKCLETYLSDKDFVVSSV